MPRGNPQPGETWEIRQGGDLPPTRGVVMWIDPGGQSLRMASGVGRLVPVTASSFTAWNFLSPAPDEHFCSQEGCNVLAYFRVPFGPSIRWVCMTHIPSGTRAMLPGETEVPVSTAPCPNCRRTSNQSEQYRTVLVYTCPTCTHQWVVVTGNGSPQLGRWFIEQGVTAIEALGALRLQPHLLLGQMAYTHMRRENDALFTVRRGSDGHEIRQGTFLGAEFDGVAGFVPSDCIIVERWPRPPLPDAARPGRPIQRLSPEVASTPGVARLGGVPDRAAIHDPTTPAPEPVREEAAARTFERIYGVGSNSPVETIARVLGRSREAISEAFAERLRDVIGYEREVRANMPVQQVSDETLREFTRTLAQRPNIEVKPGDIYRHTGGDHMVAVESVGFAEDGDPYVKFRRTDGTLSPMLLTDFRKFYSREDEPSPACIVGQEWADSKGKPHTVVDVARRHGIWVTTLEEIPGGKRISVGGGRAFQDGTWRIIVRKTTLARIMDDDLFGDD